MFFSMSDVSPSNALVDFTKVAWKGMGKGLKRELAIIEKTRIKLGRGPFEGKPAKAAKGQGGCQQQHRGTTAGLHDRSG